MCCQNRAKKAQEEDDYLYSNGEVRGFGERIRKGQPMSITIPHDTTAREDVKAFPLSLAQKGLWILEQLQSENTPYILSTNIHIQRILNTQLLEQSLNLVIVRHDALRTSIQVIE